MNRISLFRDLARPGFHTSIITTYSVDAAFYDGSLFQRLRTYGCENSILLADKHMLERAIEETPESFARAGVGYAVLPVAVENCFHPKLHIRLGSDGGSLIVGSANATAAGWGGNRELVASFEWRRHREKADDPAVLSLIRKAYDFVLPWMEQTQLASIRRKLELIHRDAAWLFEVPSNEGPVSLADGSAVDLMLERADGQAGIMRRFANLVGNQSVRRLIIVSPYWDWDLGALHDLQEQFKPGETVIALNARKPEFNVPALKHPDSVRFARVFDGSNADRFIHAKAILVEGEESDNLLLGSANCSIYALGSLEDPASNAEASMYRRLSPGTGLAALGLDLSQTLDPTDIKKAPKDQKPPTGSALPWPGSIEASGRNIRWRPTPELIDAASGAKLKLAENGYGFARIRDGVHLLELPALPAYPIIARIELADGRVTSPVLVNDELRLQQAAPGMGNRQLRAVLEKIEVGESDLLDLAALAGLIFSTPEKRAAGPQRTTGTPGVANEKEPPAEGQDYGSAEEFRRAMEAQSPARGEDQRLNIDGPDEVSLFRIVMRGIADGIAADDDLLTGDDEPPNDRDPTPTPPDPREQLPRRVFTTAQAEKRRLDVFRAMKLFETYLGTLAASELPPPRKITAEACFILRLMVEASRRAMLCQTNDGESEVYALPLAPTALNRNDTFVIRAGTMLQRLWVGSRSKPALLSRLQIGRQFDELPYDCFALVVISRWAAARCVMAMTENRQKNLAAMVNQTALEIWRATMAWPRLDGAAELDLARRLDQALGISPSETDDLLQHYRTLTAALVPVAQAAG